MDARAPSPGARWARPGTSSTAFVVSASGSSAVSVMSSTPASTPSSWPRTRSRRRRPAGGRAARARRPSARAGWPAATRASETSPHQAGVVEVRRLRVGGMRVSCRQLERLEVVLGGLLGTTDGAGVVAGAQARGQGGRVVLREAGVAGQLGGGAAGACRPAAPWRTPRAGWCARRAGGRRRPPRRAGRGGTGRSRRCSARARDPRPRRARLGRARPARRPTTALSAAWETRRPATAAARTTVTAGSSRFSRRTSRSSARSSGMRPVRVRVAPTSSSTKNALPSARPTMSRTRASGSGSGWSCWTSRRTSVRRRGSTWMRSTPLMRAQTATWRRSGWRRWRSSER